MSLSLAYGAKALYTAPGGSGPVRIANPIYDTVFKYLLDDEKVAKLMLSALLGREVLELAFRAALKGGTACSLRSRGSPLDPHEVTGQSPDTSSGERPHPVQKPDSTELLVYRMDFSATVQLEDGSRKLVLIEIQKARNASDVQRFRRYLGGNYSDAGNSYRDSAGKDQPLPILTIYFLGQGLNGIDIPVLKINRHYMDVATGNQVQIADPFVEALTHDCIVVQVNRLKNRRRTELEQLLAVLDQGQRSQSDPHLLDILEENFPDRYREVLRQLLRAGADQEVLEKMHIEDEILKEFQDHAREAADLRQALTEKDQALEEKNQALEEKDQAVEEKSQALEEKNQALEDKDRTLEEQKRLIEDLKRRLGGN